MSLDVREHNRRHVPIALTDWPREIRNNSITILGRILEIFFRRCIKCRLKDLKREASVASTIRDYTNLDDYDLNVMELCLRITYLVFVKRHPLLQLITLMKIPQ